jgi:ketosteroid isomerase-like protein
MLEENVETLRRGQHAFNRRDKAAFAAVCDPEVENIPPREWPENTPIRGVEAIWDFFVEAQEAWEEGSYEFGELIDAGRDKIVANQLREMRGKTSGASVAWSFWVVFTFRGGRVLRWEWFTDRDEALEAARVGD